MSSRELPRPTDSPGGRPRTPGVAYTALAAAFVVVLAALALTARQPAPPTIAEFAPQAVQQITVPDVTESSSERGAGGGPGLDAGVQGGESIDMRAQIDVARVRNCVGDPPRQIEDPQSPPCVPYWSGENGGATAKGVTRDEIRIADPVAWHVPMPVFETFFNTRFEFYGRRMRIIDTGAGSVIGAQDPEQERAAAVETDSRNVFASLAYGNGSIYNEELARRGVLSATDLVTFTETDMRGLDPYLWQYQMALDRIFANLGEWACARLAGRPPTHTEPTLASRRVFALIFDVMAFANFGDDAAVGELRRELGACGESLRLVFQSNRPEDAQAKTNEVLQMQRDGVTTILCVCHSRFYGERTKAASAQAYFPEWILTSYSDTHSNRDLRLWGQREQLAHTFGAVFEPRQLRPVDEPSRWASAEVDPSFDDGGDSEALKWSRWQYRLFLLLASGIQMAGPGLTASGFRDALERTDFPNPYHPNMPGAVGFEGGDHSMIQDGAEWWWSNTEHGPYANEPAGTICYADGGARHVKGAWPPGDGSLFREPCDAV